MTQQENVAFIIATLPITSIPKNNPVDIDTVDSCILSYRFMYLNAKMFNSKKNKENGKNY
jgi:hypothetical protein